MPYYESIASGFPHIYQLYISILPVLLEAKESILHQEKKQDDYPFWKIRKSFKFFLSLQAVEKVIFFSDPFMG